MLKELLRHGAKPVGDPRGCHAVALDARAPKFDGGIVTRLDSVPFGIVVNREVKRFYDEGEDFWPKRYAIWGKTDRASSRSRSRTRSSTAKGLPHFMPSVFPPVEAGSIAELAEAFELDPRALAASSKNSIARCGRAHSIRAVWTTAAPKALIRRKATGRGRSTRRRTRAIRCGRGSRLLISASRWTSRRA